MWASCRAGAGSSQAYLDSQCAVARLAREERLHRNCSEPAHEEVLDSTATSTPTTAAPGPAPAAEQSPVELFGLGLRVLQLRQVRGVIGGPQWGLH